MHLLNLPLSLLVIIAHGASPVMGPFRDVPMTVANGRANPEASAVQYVKDQGIVQGYSDGTYRPKNAINRAEFTKIIIATVLSEEDACDVKTMGFSDVSFKAWYAAPLCRAQKRAFISGYPDGRFRPERNIAMAEAVKILMRAYQLPVDETDRAVPGNPYAWAEPYFLIMQTKHALPTNWEGKPGDAVTRGQMAEMIYKLDIAQGRAQ